MSQALPGQHYCQAHQGNHSHYAEKNCVVCRARVLLSEALAVANGEIEFDASWKARARELLKQGFTSGKS